MLRRRIIGTSQRHRGPPGASSWSLSWTTGAVLTPRLVLDTSRRRKPDALVVVEPTSPRCCLSCQLVSGQRHTLEEAVTGVVVEG